MTAANATTVRPMDIRSYTVTFLTPAFLGNAQQRGQWRTPPFKHLLREWWRVAWAASNDPSDWRGMRHVEGRLFGHAWLENDQDSEGREVKARKSLLRMRLEPWSQGSLKKMPRTAPVAQGRNAVPSHLYLGYGPVKSATQLGMDPCLDPEKDKASLSLAWPDEVYGVACLEDALALIHAFGTVGGRSRNGWGSLALSSNSEAPVLREPERFSRPWQDCLAEGWAHALGKDDNGPLIWRTRSCTDWKQVIEQLGPVRKQVNTLAKSQGGRPVINQPVAGRGGRVPSNLRFKVRMDGNGNYYGVIFHMPFTPAGVRHRDAVRLWPHVHASLDRNEQLERIPA